MSLSIILIKVIFELFYFSFVPSYLDILFDTFVNDDVISQRSLFVCIIFLHVNDNFE